MQTQEYAPGRLVDIYGDILYGDMSDPTVLLWHGMQTDSRPAVRPLAETLAEHRLGVVVPDWNSHAADGGRADLMRSVVFARRFAGAADGLTVVGWSMGAAAAAGLTLHATDLQVTLTWTVCLGGAFTAIDPISGLPVRDLLVPDRIGAPFVLLHGVHDDVIPVAATHEFAADLERVGWPVQVVDLDTDHWAIAGARYDATLDQCFAAEDTHSRSVAADVAARIAALLGR